LENGDRINTVLAVTPGSNEPVTIYPVSALVFVPANWSIGKSG
jgi:hypothetical protein